MASILQAYPPEGASLGLAVLFRTTLLPALAGVAVALSVSSGIAGGIAAAWLLAVELTTRRRRWTWRRLGALPAVDEPPADLAHARPLARCYAVGVAALAAGLAFWQAADGAWLDHAAVLTAIVVGTAAAAAGCVGFEYLVRSPRRPRLRTQLGNDDVLDAGELSLLLLLLPKVFWRGAATLMVSAMVSVGAAAGMAFVTAPTMMDGEPTLTAVLFIAPIGLACLAGTAFIMSLVEANNATTFVEARRRQEPEAQSTTDRTSA